MFLLLLFTMYWIENKMQQLFGSETSRATSLQFAWGKEDPLMDATKILKWYEKNRAHTYLHLQVATKSPCQHLQVLYLFVRMQADAVNSYLWAF